MYLNSSDVLEFLKCPLCHNIFIEPKGLKCGHVYCNQCIKELAKIANENFKGNSSNPEFSCPECHEKIETSVVERLPTVLRVVEMIDSIKSNNSTLEVEYMSCNNCKENVKKDQLFYCGSCPAINGEDMYYCAKCSVMKHNGHDLVLVKDITTALERQETKSQILSQIRLVTQNYEQNIRGLAVEHAKSELLITIKDSIEFLANASGIDLIPSNSKITKDDLKKCHDVYNKFINLYKEIIADFSVLDNDYIKRLEELKQTYRNVFTSQIAPYYPYRPLPMIFNPPASSTSINDNSSLFNSDAQQT